MNILIWRILLISITIAGIPTGSSPAPRKVVFFQNHIPSNLYVNAAHGPVHIKDDPDGKTQLIQLMLYPADKKSRDPKTARALVNSGSIYGLVTLRQDNPPTGPTFVAGVMKGLTPGKHELTIHRYGDIEPKCHAVGPVYNPYTLELAPTPTKRNIGDLGFMVADDNGKAIFAMNDPFVTLVGPRSVVGRAVVITKLDAKQKGEVVACGVIGYAQ